MMSLIPLSKAALSMRKPPRVVPMPVQDASGIGTRMYERDRCCSALVMITRSFRFYHVSQDRWDLRGLMDVQ